MNRTRYAVWLYHEPIGFIDQVGDYTVFRFNDSYLDSPDRVILGLTFEEHLTEPTSSHLRLPPWFSNLLPEGRLREWIAMDRGVSADREMELLVQVGHDLPGAVQVVEAESLPDNIEEPVTDGINGNEPNDGRVPGWHFSLAGVGLKFSMVQQGDRLTLPAFGEGGDWIVKLPDPSYDCVPVNENAMMSLAHLAGIEIPPHRLIHRDELEGLPANIWPKDEEYAYAVRRFDRDKRRGLIHIEDFAQVRNVYPYYEGKYQGNFETVASLAYRGRDEVALEQVARRIAFNVLISNGDAHLKNWSLIYHDRRHPTLSPAYDLVSTEMYRRSGDPEDLGLKFGGTRRFDQISLTTFSWLESKLKANASQLVEVAEDTIKRAIAGWPQIAATLDGTPHMRDQIDASIARRRLTLLRP